MGTKVKRNYQQQYSASDAPANLDNHIFYGLKLDEEQLKFANDIYDKEKLVILCNARAGTGKAQPINTLIPTPDGYKYLGNIMVGDFVFDRLGNPTRVLGVFPQGKQRAYKVTLTDGRSTICGPDHLWSFFCDGSSRKTFRTESITQMLTRSVRTDNGASRYKIPANDPVKYSRKDFLIDPYIIGVFLGDGCCRERYLSISSPELEIINEISLITGYNPVKYCNDNYTWKFKNSNGNLIKTDMYFGELEDCLMQYSYNKRVPPIYMFGDIEQRFSLLQGLLDTDGNIVRAENRYNVRYSTTSYNLAMDIMQLGFSLGLSLSLNLDNRVYKYTTNAPCYTINFRVPNEIKPMLFRKSKKRELALESLNYTKSRKYNLNNIFSIEDLGYDDEMVCIYVDNPEHLYLTNDFIVTHNTTISLGVANLLVQYGFYDGIIYIASPTQEQRQGYLPGGQEEKSAPYMEPLIEAMNTLGIFEKALITEDDIQAAKSGEAYIRFTVDTYLRGVNFENKVVIIDEAQNYYGSNLKKTLTRIHDNCKVVIIGHTEQCDLYKHPDNSGFKQYLDAFREIDDDPRVSICELNTNHRGWFSNFCDSVIVRG